MNFDYAIYGDMDPEVVEYLPHDINGDKIYRMECQPHEWIDRQKDGLWWEMHTMKWNGFFGKRKVGQCMGQYICANPHFPGVRAGWEENNSNFKVIGQRQHICKSCGMFHIKQHCGVEKLTEYSTSSEVLIVFNL